MEAAQVKQGLRNKDWGLLIISAGVCVHMLRHLFSLQMKCDVSAQDSNW